MAIARQLRTHHVMHVLVQDVRIAMNRCLFCQRDYPEPIVIHEVKHRRAPVRDIIAPEDVCPNSVTQDDLVNGYYTHGDFKYECERGDGCNPWYG
jgi:hypothetical protein